jgi:hypothetical protein
MVQIKQYNDDFNVAWALRPGFCSESAVLAYRIAAQMIENGVWCRADRDGTVMVEFVEPSSYNNHESYATQRSRAITGFACACADLGLETEMV